ncbi:SDR family NAD(P)-dependent oxidoreductase [Brevundimonas mediterranea]|uniref:NAD(P)-dependent dehydrogenase (Short-subunit alcohol dehydrogenase family) n=1 Tax=Brevundimonas mediterranea TaxID=74329 RepID=A0A7W6A4X8_9CAUL|nr:SDR family NAD(P)-dependent oxidoreductase [Brevundimonas mediterranea]MBB3873406.1 NAD(P)-dependent dehydrogenase (short-subunit alcohol dehydrogenase family) [Brevundimonas mediterranea]
MNGSAVVIGATGGVGRALVDRLIAQGTHQTVWAVSRTGGEVAGAQVLAADLEDEASLAEAAQRIGQGAAPTLIVLATGVLHDGFQPERSLRQLEADHMLRDYRVNAVGPALAAKHLLPLTPRDQRAVFAALSARVGSIGDNRLGGWHSYRASKAALHMILRNLAIEMARSHPMAVIAGLHPGTVDTGLSAPFQKGVAEGRLFTPDYSAERLLTVMAALTPADSGGVFAWDGARIPE